MVEIIKQNNLKSNKEFEKLLAQDLDQRKFVEGEITEGVISKIDDKFVFIDLGLKSEGAIPIEEFKLTKELDKLKVGEKVEILLEKLENYSGDLVISREKARKFQPNKLLNCVAASDAFFPFTDGAEKLIQAGVSAIIQPQGSIRDKEIIKLADKTGTVLIFSKTRHFKH